MKKEKKPGLKKSKSRGKVTVIIPVLNESKTIASVVKFSLANRRVSEVLVIDDGSTDSTVELAERAGARVITSSLLGKGVSMEDGLQAARTEFILYLDGDLQGLRKDLISRMIRPLVKDEADFVKANFKRKAGRVTILTAKPLLQTYFPELADLAQPLGGIVAARRALLEQLRYENDYGVDVGLLIDAAGSRARIKEVPIGRIRHQSQTLERLGEMATQVARTILERAAEWGRLRVTYLRAAKERDRLRKAEFSHSLGMLKRASKLALFDMDGTLLNGRFVMELAYRTQKMDELNPLLDNMLLNPVQRAKKIAALFTGVPRSMFERVAREIPLNPGAVETVVGLRKAGYLVGIITDSYRIAAETVRRRVFADFSISHVLRFRGDRATGAITLSPAMKHEKGCKEHRLCKLNVLRHFQDEVGFPASQVLAVGDSENDACLLEACGLSVAFNPKSEQVRDSGKYLVENDLRNVLRIIGSPVPAEAEIRFVETDHTEEKK